MASLIQQRLRSAAFDIQWAEQHIAATIAKLLAQTPDGYPTSGEGRGAGVSDPTSGAAAAGERARMKHARLDLLTMHIYGLVGELVQEIRTTSDPGTDTTAEASRARCSGGTGDWADPTCERNAVKTYRITGVEYDLCDACRQRYHRDQRRATMSP